MSNQKDKHIKINTSRKIDMPKEKPTGIDTKISLTATVSTERHMEVATLNYMALKASSGTSQTELL